MAEYPSNSRAPITITEYINTQKEHGSCSAEFKDAVKRTSKAGLFMGVPLGLWVSYTSTGKPTLNRIKPYVGKTLYVTLASVITFGGIGVMIGTYNCLRVVRS
ncbi:unnamed protein product [Bursaphelenchus okinawaensis]|uniref:Transmembrane protein n=1 Tax=Bursaphelenchus okinawaensis TaxID=465554 RepID=A0A811K5I5_9BILA|nr:unnamed protein product [Bursaphelenchus okinawaensis]CAG9091812.1 unnamed protein product [Bursaphelenchus okinawaensis]